MCLKGIGLCAENVVNDLGFIVNVIGGPTVYDQLMSARIVTFDNE